MTTFIVQGAGVMTFLEGVNRLLRIATVLSGDDDDLADFTSTQHRAALNLAKVAIQSTLGELVANRLIPYEEADGNITYVADQRTYDLPSDFMRFKGDPFLLELDSNDESANKFVAIYPGGEEKLRWAVLDYRSQKGNPIWFYPVMGSSKKIGLYPVPDSSHDGIKTRFPYERGVTVVSESDNLPFTDDLQAQAFIDMAQRRFELMYSRRDTDPDLLASLQNDPIYINARSSLLELMRYTQPDEWYGFRYG